MPTLQVSSTLKVKIVVPDPYLDNQVHAGPGQTMIMSTKATKYTLYEKKSMLGIPYWSQVARVKDSSDMKVSRNKNVEKLMAIYNNTQNMVLN